MAAFWLDGEAQALRLERLPLGGGHDEAWLQRLLFTRPELVPLDRLEPGAGTMVPLRRELPLRKPGGTVFLDLLGVTRHGRPVLVECKLWRNPQARREVVAQIVEYAALMRRWSYADLLAQLGPSFGRGPNPLFDRVREAGGTMPEADFVDAVSSNLRSGDVHLVIAGDGIREDLVAIADHRGAQGARLALLEVQLWTDGSGRVLVVPQVPLRTEVLRQRLLLDAGGAPVRVVDEDEADAATELAAVDPGRAASRAENRAFWQRFIVGAAFDHADQPRPRHGGDNWVRLPLPEPARWLTVYRARSGSGLTYGFVMVPQKGTDLLAHLAWDVEELRRETGLAELSSGPELALRCGADAIGDEDAQLAWLWDVANRLVTALRSRLLAAMEPS